jgi:hypothetical protein
VLSRRLRISRSLIFAEEQAGARGARIGYDRANVEILGRGGKWTDNAFDR